LIQTPPLADLHVHLGGCLDYRGCLGLIRARETPSWAPYEEAYLAAFGRPSSAQAIVERARAGDASAVDDFRAIFEFADPDGGQFDRFQAKFGLIKVGVGLTERSWWELTEAETVAAFVDLEAHVHPAQVEQGLGLVETRLYLRGAPVHRARAVLIALLRRCAEKRPEPRRQIVLSLSRQDPWPHWEMVQNVATGPLGAHLIGVDFCHVEEGFPPKGLADFFASLKAFNRAHPHRALALLYHVGESFDDKSIESAVRWVVEAAEAGADRLGHAIALGIDPRHFGPHRRTESVAERRDQIEYESRHLRGLRAHGLSLHMEALRAESAALERRPDDHRVEVVYDEARLDAVRAHQRFAAERVRATSAVVEVCPTSNRRIAGLRDDALHPIHQFVAWDVPFVVASDDPGLFGVSLSEELDYACAIVGARSLTREALISRSWRYRSEALVGRVAPGLNSD